jgi:mannose-6-phosphate isomerase-like protein (cupin superfamily)
VFTSELHFDDGDGGTVGGAGGHAHVSGLDILGPGEHRGSFWIDRERIDFKATGTETQGGYFLFHNTALPGYATPLHVHTNADEAFYVIDGEFVFRSRDDEHPVDPGSFVYVPRGTAHAYRNAGEKVGRLIVVFTPAGTEQFFYEGAIEAKDDSLDPPAPDFDRLGEAAERFGTVLLEP